MSCAHAAGIRPATFGVLRLPRSVVVGAQQRFAVANIAAEFGTNVLVCTDPRLAVSEDLSALVKSLEDRNLTVVTGRQHSIVDGLHVCQPEHHMGVR